MKSSFKKSDHMASKGIGKSISTNLKKAGFAVVLLKKKWTLQNFIRLMNLLKK